MKARLALLLIFVTTAAMAGTLYYVMKHSGQFQHQASDKMTNLWVENSPKVLGPYTDEAIIVQFPSDESGWNLKLEGEKLLMKPLKVDYIAAKPASEAAKAEAWKLAEVDLKTHAVNLFKLQKNPEQVLISAP